MFVVFVILCSCPVSDIITDRNRNTSYPSSEAAQGGLIHKEVEVVLHLQYTKNVDYFIKSMILFYMDISSTPAHYHNRIIMDINSVYRELTCQ